MILASALGTIYDIRAKEEPVTALCLVIYHSVVILN
jgi:hypothetical protein